MITTHHQLFGPAQNNGCNIQVFGTTYVHPGAAFTPNTKQFFFNYGLHYAVLALWRISWIPNNTAARARLFHADDGPLNITQICEIISDGSASPTNSTMDFTGIFNQLVSAKVLKSIGHQFKDDGINGSTLYESRLEITWAD